MKRHLRGMSLIEVLVSAFIMMLVVGVVSRSFSVGLRFEDRSLKRRYD
ncbi:prepilin-type N-terminal cleavage/methylation domain-containing protein, partial [Acinetobacter baumannii]